MSRVRLIILLLFLCQCTVNMVLAQNVDGNPMIADRAQWLVPSLAALDNDTSLRSTTVAATASVEEGDFRNIYDAEQTFRYGISANGRSRINDNLTVAGNFSYTYLDRRNQGWAMLTFPSSNPFMLADNEPGDQTSERYRIDAEIDYSIFRRVKIGSEFGLYMANTAKLRDIRNRNVYNNYYLSPNINVGIFDGVALSFAYRYSNNTEELRLSRFGNDKPIYVNSTEGLWFGQRQPYTSTQFPSQKYDGNENRFSFALTHSSFTTKSALELSFYGGQTDVEAQVEERKVGFVETDGFRAKVAFAKCQNDVRNSVNLVVARNTLVGFVPIQSREHTGVVYRYVQYGRVKRYVASETEAYLNFSHERKNFNLCGSIDYLQYIKRTLIFPQEFRQTIDRFTVDLLADYVLRTNGEISAVHFGLGLKYSAASGEMLEAMRSDVAAIDYHCETAALEQQFVYESSDYLAPQASASVDIPTSLGLLNVRLQYDASVALGQRESLSRGRVGVRMAICIF